MANPLTPDTPSTDPLTPGQRRELWALQESLLREAKAQREELRVRLHVHTNEVQTRQNLIAELDERAEALAEVLRKDEPPYDGF